MTLEDLYGVDGANRLRESAEARAALRDLMEGACGGTLILPPCLFELLYPERRIPEPEPRPMLRFKI